MKEKHFPNGFRNWMETFYEIVTSITLIIDKSPDISLKLDGTQGVVNLCEKLTDEFENINKDRWWDGNFYEEVENFVKQKIEQI